VPIHAQIQGFQSADRQEGVKRAGDRTRAALQKLAATATGMGVKEPVSLNAAGGTVTVSGSSATKCTFKVGAGDTPQIQGVSCK